MNRILYSIYTDKYPNLDSGGPNNIIYKIIQGSTNSGFVFDYLSSDLFVENLKEDNLFSCNEHLSIKKKITSYLGENSQLYRNIFSSKYYLPYHFYKKNKKFRSFNCIDNKYDIIHCHDSISLSLLNRENINSSKIFTVHSKGPLSDELKNMSRSKILFDRISENLKILEKRGIEYADIITFPSKASREYFENSSELKLKNDKVRIIYNGVDTEWIKNIKAEEKIFYNYSINKREYDLILLNISAHSHEKKIDVLLNVIQKLKKTYYKNILLINIGVGSLTNNLIKLSTELGIKNNVKFLGKLSNNEVIKFIKLSDIFIMTSEKVIFDLVVLEALACGICCVVSNDGGNKEIIKDGINGYLIETNDIDKIAQKIISLDTNKTKFNAIETAKQFSVNKMVNEYFQLYKSML